MLLFLCDMARYSFYHTERWRKLRQLVIDKAGGICEECHINPGTIAHHKIWVEDSNVNRPEIVWSLDNLECVCQTCHNRIHSTGKADSSVTMEGYAFDDEGNLIYIGDENKLSDDKK